MVKRKGRPRKTTVRRDARGKSRGEPPDLVRSVVLAYRTREVGKLHAGDPLAGFTLGRLLLRHRTDRTDPSGVTELQYNAGETWANIVRRHARIMGYSLDQPKALQFERIGGVDCSEPPSDQEVAKTRDDFRLCYDALMAACQIPEAGGLRIRDVTYGVCVENWPANRLTMPDYGCLRLGLNALARALGLDGKRTTRIHA